MMKISALWRGAPSNMRDGISFGEYGTRFTRQSPDCFFHLGVNQPGSLLKRSQIAAVGALRPELQLCMDLDLWTRLLLESGVSGLRLIPESVATYRYHSQSKTCSRNDAFAQEEFLILHDLAAALGAHLTDKLSAVRRLSHSPPLSFARPDSVLAKEVDRAFIDRLIGSDNLLFRAIARSVDGPPEISSLFLQTLGTISPYAAELLQQPAPFLEAKALIEAQQSAGTLSPKLFLRALLLAPKLSTVRDGLRLIFRAPDR